MKEQPDSQWLEELLKEEEPYLDNDAFSKKVVESLPKRKRMSWRMKRRIIKAAALFFGLFAGIFAIRGSEVDLNFLQSLPPVVMISVPVVGGFLLLAAATLWVVTDRA